MNHDDAFVTRNIALGAQAFAPLALAAMVRPSGFSVATDTFFVAFGLCGVAVLLLTSRVREGWLQKAFFLLAGGAGTALLLTYGGFLLLSALGHKPGGDGGGITVPVLVGAPMVFLVAAVGACVCLVLGRRGPKDARLSDTCPTERKQP